MRKIRYGIMPEFPAYFDRYEARRWAAMLTSLTDVDLARLHVEIERRRKAFQDVLDHPDAEGKVRMTLGQEDEGIYGLTLLGSDVSRIRERRERARRRKSETMRKNRAIREKAHPALEALAKEFEDKLVEAYLETADHIVQRDAELEKRGLPSPHYLHVTLSSLVLDLVGNRYYNDRLEDVAGEIADKEIGSREGRELWSVRFDRRSDLMKAYRAERIASRVMKRLKASGKYVQCLGQGRRGSEVRGLAVKSPND